MIAVSGAAPDPAGLGNSLERWLDCGACDLRLIGLGDLCRSNNSMKTSNPHFTSSLFRPSYDGIILVFRQAAHFAHHII